MSPGTVQGSRGLRPLATTRLLWLAVSALFVLA